MTDVVIIDTSGTESWKSRTITIVVASRQGSGVVRWVAQYGQLVEKPL